MTKLDLWISSAIELTPDKNEIHNKRRMMAFYKKVKTLPLTGYQEDDHDNFFLIGLKNAAYGDNLILSRFLLIQSRFNRLTDTKRLVLAWVMQYPQRKKDASRNTAEKLDSLVYMVVFFEEWWGYKKEKAIKSAIEGIFGHDDGSEVWLTKFESLRTQLYRAIKKGGQYHEPYLKAKEAEQEIKERQQSG